MGTHANIGIENPDGSVSAIYCHYDGYVSHTGNNLCLYYRSEQAIRQLLSRGGIDQLKTTPKACDKLDGNEPMLAFNNVEDFAQGIESSGRKVYCHYSYLFKDDEWLHKHLKEPFRPLLPEVFIPSESIARIMILVNYNPMEINPNDIPDLVKESLKVPGLQVEEVKLK